MNLKIRGYNGQGFGSGFIRRFTFGTFSHVSLVFDMGDYTEEIESIQGDGVIRHDPYSASDKDFIEFDVPMSQEQIATAHLVAASLIGSDYDWKGIWGFIKRKNKHNPDKWFCSEIVAYVLYEAGYPLSRREPYRETPTSVCESYRLDEPVDPSGSA